MNKGVLDVNNKVFGRLFYLNNFSYCKNNKYLDEIINDYLIMILDSKNDYYLTLLKQDKENHKYNYYMYILECISNSLIHLINLTFNDYLNNKDNLELSNQILNTYNKLKNKYDNIIELYDYYLSPIKDQNHNYKKRKYIKNNLKR